MVLHGGPCGRVGHRRTYFTDDHPGNRVVICICGVVMCRRCRCRGVGTTTRGLAWPPRMVRDAAGTTGSAGRSRTFQLAAGTGPSPGRRAEPRRTAGVVPVGVPGPSGTAPTPRSPVPVETRRPSRGCRTTCGPPTWIGRMRAELTHAERGQRRDGRALPGAGRADCSTSIPSWPTPTRWRPSGGPGGWRSSVR